MALISTGVSPEVQSIASDIATAEAQRRMTLGQLMAAREQGLRQAQQLRGAQVLAAMDQAAQMADTRQAAMEQIALQRALMEEEQLANLLSGTVGAAGAGLVVAEGIEDPDEKKKKKEKEKEEKKISPTSVTGLTPAAQPSVAPDALQMAQDRAEMNVINQEPDPMKRALLMRAFTQKQRARQVGGL